MRQKVIPLALALGLFVLRKPQANPWVLVFLACSCLPAGSQNLAVVPATQLPQGGKVLGGAASITQSTGNLQINQTTPRAVLEWNSFNLGTKAQVNFVQPSASSVALNRVLDTQASQILGRINANGQVFISNPNGVLFGPTAQVDVGGLLITTHGISNEDFMNGKSSFQGTSSAAVVNQGELRAALGGYIALLAPQVRNEGVIVAKEGTVALAAGEKITLQFAGQSLTAVQVDRAVVDALVDNQHLVRAEGGLVVMTARSANALLQSVVKNSGTVQAPSLVSRQGRIILEGGSVGRVEVTGQLSATGGKGLAGGSVWVTGDQVTLGNAARIDVSGDTAGGQVLIGGGWPESVGPVAKSSEVNIGDDVSIKAIASGTGNGGYVETSAKKVQIAATAKVDTSAANGKAGQWVIDPVDIDINSGLASAISTALNSGDVLVSTDSGNTPSTASGETSGVGNISVNSPISWSANRLTLKAANNIYVNQVLYGSGTASLRFHMTSVDGIDRIYFKAPIYLPEGNSLSAVDGPAGDIDFRVITRLGSAGSTTGTDLQGISGNLNGYFALGADIDASATSLWNGGAGFMPIGNSVTPFAGALTGLGHVISNLTINRPTTDSVGLFGRSVGVLSELGIVNASIVGANQVGTLVGNNAGYTTTNFATGSVTGQSSVGGLMGVLDGYGTARNSYAKTNVSVTGNADAGGLIGLVNVGTVYKTYSTGAVTNLGGGAPTGVGGLIGRLGTGPRGPVDVSIAGFWDTTLSGQASSAAGVGLDTASTMRWSSLAQFNLNTNDFWLNYFGKTTPLLKAFLTPLTITAADASKTYDGLVYGGPQAFSTSISTNSYLLGVDTMQYGGSGATAVNAGSYSIVPSGLYSNDNRGYAISYVNGTLSIQKADLTLSGSRPYDGSTVMAGTYLTANGVNGETFSVTGAGATGNLSTRNVQTAQPLATSAGLTLGTSSNGGLSSNYNALGIAGSSVTVTPKSVTLTAPTGSKVYDGTSSYVASSDDLSALSAQLGVAGDGVSASTLSFDNKNAGLANKTLALSAATVSDGNSGLNYALSYASNSNSSITPKVLSISGITAADKVYDGTATAAVSTAGVSASVL
ncbi:MAG: filamentous hemagglutinin N-terminal domain-containing protein, partial [Limnohabitans sp.]|nr:filamentous hemagglutinin N-terminal domain-containing protein [Limnohabitans sp.]